MFEPFGEVSDHLVTTAYSMHHHDIDVKHMEANETYENSPRQSRWRN